MVLLEVFVEGVGSKVLCSTTLVCTEVIFYISSNLLTALGRLRVSYGLSLPSPSTQVTTATV